MSKIISKTHIFYLLVVILLSAGGFYVWKTHFTSPAELSQPPKQVEIITATPKTIEITHELPGRITAKRQSEIRPQVEGIITKRLFKQGDRVEKGTQLYQIDDARYQASLGSAKADLKAANANLEAVKSREKRYKGLVEMHAVSQQDYDDVLAELEDAKAQIAIAQSDVDIAQLNLDYTKVYAPISGRIGKSLVTEGALVTTNQDSSLAVITQLDPIYVDMQQFGIEDKRLRARLQDDKPIPVNVIMDKTTGGEDELTGTLAFSEVTINETTGSVTMRAVIPNPKGTLLPGLFVHASMDLGQETVILVPQRSTTRAIDGSLIVWIVDENGKAQMRKILASVPYEDNWIVEKGLSDGEKIVVEGYIGLENGLSVQTEMWNEKNKKNETKASKAE